MDAQGRAGWTALRPAGSHGLSWPRPLLLDMLGSRNQARAWSRHKNSKKHLLTQGPLRETAALYCSAHSRQPAQHQGRPQATGHAMPCCLDWAWLGAGLHRPERRRARQPQHQKVMAHG